jgi:hypothetical protein
MRKLTNDPIPRGATAPMVTLMIECANALIRHEMNLVRREFPTWTDHEIQREAKRRELSTWSLPWNLTHARR